MHCKTVNDAIKALKSIYGTELMEDNTNECRNRLYLRFKEYCKNKNLTAEQFNIASENVVMYYDIILYVLTHSNGTMRIGVV